MAVLAHEAFGASSQVFSYMNLARAFAEIQMGVSFFCLHKNKWWQTSRGPMLDSGAFVAGLEYATGVEATCSASPARRTSLQRSTLSKPSLSGTWLVTDDVEGDVRGARLFGMRTALVRTGSFARDARVCRPVAGHRGLLGRPVPRPARGGSDRRVDAMRAPFRTIGHVG